MTLTPKPAERKETRVVVPTLGALEKRAKGYFGKMHEKGEPNAIGLLEHGLDAARLAINTRAIEPFTIRGARKAINGNRTLRDLGPKEFKDVIRGAANATVYQVLAYHTLSGGAGVRKPNFFSPQRMEWELDIFRKLLKLDSNPTATDAQYEEVLRDKMPIFNCPDLDEERQRLVSLAPMSFLGRMHDLGITHTYGDDEQFNPFIRRGREGSKIFRQYGQLEEIRDSIRNSAHAAKVLWGPAAEKSGYPVLAGEIFKQAYYVDHRYLFDHVMRQLRDEAFKAELEETKVKMKEVAHAITTVLRLRGYEITVELREQKHEGKIMNKFYKRMADEHKKLRSTLSISEYFKVVSALYTVDSLHDVVALTVIVKGKWENGAFFAVEDYDDRKSGAYIDKVQDEVYRIIEDILGPDLDIHHEFKCKKNGYKSHHNDVLRKGKLPVELIVRTAKWHKDAAQGGSAHSIYLAGEEGRGGLVRLLGEIHKDQNVLLNDAA